MTGPIRQRKDRRALDEFYRLGPGVSTKVSKEMIVGHMGMVPRTRRGLDLGALSLLALRPLLTSGLCSRMHGQFPNSSLSIP